MQKKAGASAPAFFIPLQPRVARKRDQDKSVVMFPGYGLTVMVSVPLELLLPSMQMSYGSVGAKSVSSSA